MTWLVGISWLLIAVAVVLFISEYKRKTKKYDNWVSFITLIAFIFLFVGIFTDDPFLSEYFPISLRFEILIELLAGGWLIWMSYLNPLKERVINTEKDISYIKADVTNIKSDIAEIKPYIMKKTK